MSVAQFVGLPLKIACLSGTKPWLSFSSVCFCSWRKKKIKFEVVFVLVQENIFCIWNWRWGEKSSDVIWNCFNPEKSRKPDFCTCWFSAYLHTGVSVHTLCGCMYIWTHACAVPIIVRQSTDLWIADCFLLSYFMKMCTVSGCC